MLQNSFFTLSNIQGGDTGLAANIQLNPSHSIFEGHFPGNPVVPGVCMMQMVKEVLESHLDKKLVLVKALDAKFLSVINPVKTQEIDLTIKFINTNDDSISINALLMDKETVVLKFKGIFVQKQ